MNLIREMFLLSGREMFLNFNIEKKLFERSICYE